MNTIATLQEKLQHCVTENILRFILVALIAEDELSSLLECVYLLRSPKNAKRLFRALEWTQTETPQTLAELKEELVAE